MKLKMFALVTTLLAPPAAMAQYNSPLEEAQFLWETVQGLSEAELLDHAALDRLIELENDGFDFTQTPELHAFADAILVRWSWASDEGA